MSSDGRRRERDASWPVALATVDRAEPVRLDHPGAVRAQLLSLLRGRPASADGGPHRLLVVVTGDRGEQGRSTLAADLAVALAGEGMRVALVDLDLGHPAQHRLFELPEAEGLAEVALGRVPLERAMRRLRTGRVRGGPDGDRAGGEPLERGSVEVLTAGALPVGERLEALAGPVVGEVLELVSERVDIVLVDMPPTGRAGFAWSPFPTVDALVVVTGRNRRRRRLLDAFRPVLDGAAPPARGGPQAPVASGAGPWAAQPAGGGRADAWLAAALLAGGAGALLLTSTGADTVLRPILTLLFLGFAPGAAFVWLVRGLDLGTKVVASIALSLALGTMTAQAMLWAHAWSPTTGLVVLVSLTVVGVLLQGWRWLRRRPGPDPGTGGGRGAGPGRGVRRTRPGEAGRTPPG